MPNLSKTRHKFTVAIAALALVDVGCVAYLLSPWSPSAAARQTERESLRVQKDAKEKEAAPLRGMENKLRRADVDIKNFYQRLPQRSSAISDELGKLATQTNVKLSQARYEMKDADVAGLKRVVIDANLGGDYLQVVKFINSLERDKTFFILDSIALGEQQGGSVQLQIKLETYMRATL